MGLHLDCGPSQSMGAAGACAICKATQCASMLLEPGRWGTFHLLAGCYSELLPAPSELCLVGLALVLVIDLPVKPVPNALTVASLSEPPQALVGSLLLFCELPLPLPHVNDHSCHRAFDLIPWVLLLLKVLLQTVPSLCSVGQASSRALKALTWLMMIWSPGSWYRLAWRS